MDFAFSEKCESYRRRVLAFMNEYVYPNEDELRAQLDAPPGELDEASFLELAQVRGAGVAGVVAGVGHHAAGIVATLLALGEDGLQQLLDLLRVQWGHGCVRRRSRNALRRPASPVSWGKLYLQDGQQMTLQPVAIGQLGRHPCPSASNSAPHSGHRSILFTSAGISRATA